VNGVSFLAGLAATRRFHGVGAGSTLAEVTAAVPGVDFIDVADKRYGTLRRDYGFVELFFTRDRRWTMVGGTLQLHRLAADEHRMADTWREHTGVDFPEYTSWRELREELDRTPGAPEFEVHDQGGHREYRAPGHTAAVVVVNDPEEERGHWPGHGDVWSVSFR
jgi:hypothetical protein